MNDEYVYDAEGQREYIQSNFNSNNTVKVDFGC